MIDRETLYERIADAINISEDMFDYAEAEYKKIAKWIEENSKDYNIVIYPQGSFALGTAVKPYDREDEYDVDLVCEYQRDYGFSAKHLKKTEVYSILTRYARAYRIKEKRRCWQVTYEHNKKFHLDVIPAVFRESYIDITEQLSSEKYEYIGSNPKGYILNRSQLSDHHNTESAVGTFVYMPTCFQTPFQIEAEFSCPIFCVDALH